MTGQVTAGTAGDGYRTIPAPRRPDVREADDPDEYGARRRVGAHIDRTTDTRDRKATR